MKIGVHYYVLIILSIFMVSCEGNDKYIENNFGVEECSESGDGNIICIENIQYERYKNSGSIVLYRVHNDENNEFIIPILVLSLEGYIVEPKDIQDEYLIKYNGRFIKWNEIEIGSDLVSVLVKDNIVTLECDSDYKEEGYKCFRKSLYKEIDNYKEFKLYSPVSGYRASISPIVCNEMMPSILYENDEVIIYLDDGGCKSDKLMSLNETFFYSHSQLYNALSVTEIIELAEYMESFPIRVEHK